MSSDVVSSDVVSSDVGMVGWLGWVSVCLGSVH